MVVILMMKAMSQMTSCTNNWRPETKQKQKNWQRDTDKKTKLQKKISGTQQYNETLEPSRPQNFPLVFLGKSIGRRRCTSQQHTSRWQFIKSTSSFAKKHRCGDTETSEQTQYWSFSMTNIWDDNVIFDIVIFDIGAREQYSGVLLPTKERRCPGSKTANGSILLFH